jgi:hypothetical protein
VSRFPTTEVGLHAALVAGAAWSGSLLAEPAGRNFTMRVGDRAFVNDAGLICTDQLQTALKATRPYARTIGRVALVCTPTRGGLSAYYVRVSELGVIVHCGTRVVFTGTNS